MEGLIVYEAFIVVMKNCNEIGLHCSIWGPINIEIFKFCPKQKGL
jgi:hypothetical protein